MMLLSPFKLLLGVCIRNLIAGSAAQIPLAKTVLQMFAAYAKFVDIKVMQDQQLVPLLSEVLVVPQLQVGRQQRCVCSCTTCHVIMHSFFLLAWRCQEETLNCVFDLAFRKFKPEESGFHLDLLELMPTACANVLQAPHIERYTAQKRAAIAMSEMASAHGIWLFSKAGSGRDDRTNKVVNAAGW